MLEIVVCDDNAKILEYNSKLIEKCLAKNKIQGQVVLKATNSYIVEEFLKHNSANVFFLDIDLKTDSSGFDLAERIREKNVNAYLVFITAHLEYVFQSFKFKTFGYIAKPVSEDIVEEWILRIQNDYLLSGNTPGEERSIQLKFGSNIYRVKEKDIVYVQKEGQKTLVHTRTSTINYSDSLESIENLLSKDIFVRCHKSMLVNKSFIKEVRFKNNSILLETGQVISMGRTYRKDIEKACTE